MMNKKELEFNELAELQDLAKEGVTIGLPEDIVSIHNDEAEEEKNDNRRICRKLC